MTGAFTEGSMSRCAHCQMPKCWGRTVSGLADVTARILKREHGAGFYEGGMAMAKRARIGGTDE